MKKTATVILMVILCLSLAACDLSFSGNSGQITSNLTLLPTPQIRHVTDGYVYWDEVPNASSYVIKINGYQESAGNSLKFSIAAVIDSKIEYDVPTDLHIYVKAKGNQILYGDSDWSEEYLFSSYVKSKVSTDTSGKRVLDTPVFSYDSENNVIKWNSVSGANGYEISIDSKTFVLPQMIECEYQPNVGPDEQFNFSMRALAPENDDKTVNSDWTRTATFTYTPKSVMITDAAAVEKAKQWGIGYAYDFINDVYFDVTSSKVSDPILDLNKLFSTVKLVAQPSHHLEYDSVYSESISEFQFSVCAALSNEVSFGGKYEGFSANVSVGLKNEAKIDYKEYNQAGFLYCYAFAENKNYRVYDYGGTSNLAQLLSPGFLSVINRDASLEETAKYILNTYGTHLILGVKTGGKLEYYYTFATNNSKAAADFKAQYQSKSSAGYVDLINASSNNTFSVSLAASIDKNETKQDKNFIIEGGHTEGIKDFNLSDELVSSWYASIVNGSDEENSKSIGVAKEGMVYLPDLIRNINPELASSLDTLIQERATSEYNNIVSRFDTARVQFGDHKNYTYIYTPNEFIEQVGNDPDGNYAIMNDLDFNGISLVPKGEFSGVLRGYMRDGEKPVLKNFKLSSTNQQYLGLFSSLTEDAMICDLDVRGCVMDFKSDNKSYKEGSFGVFAGMSSGTIKNCSVTDSTFTGYIYKNVGTNEYVKLNGGAICGWNKTGTIENCFSKNDSFTARSNGGVTDGFVECNIGGIAGMNSQKSMTNGCSSAEITIAITLRGGKTWTFINAKMQGRAGGIVGYNSSDSSVLNCNAEEKDLKNYNFKFEKAESCNYDDNTSKGVIAGKNDGNIS